MKPKLHRNAEGKPISWAISQGLMEFLDSSLNSKMQTLEIGAGVSTLIFAMHECAHKCIIPDQKLADRILNFCDDNSIRTNKLDFTVNFSEQALPTMNLRGLDLVLIDGRHGFPAPFIDWYYTADALNINGILIVDDTHIWTGEILRDFLLEDIGYNFLQEIDGKTAVFEKVGDSSHSAEWHRQPFVTKHSNYQPEAEQCRLMRRYKLNRAKELAMQGKFLTLTKKLISEFRQ